MTKTRTAIAIAAAALLLSSTAALADRQVTVTDQEFQAWGAMQPVVERCLGQIALRHDSGTCVELSIFLGQFGQKVLNAQPAAAPAPSPSPAPPAPPPAAAPQPTPPPADKGDP